MIASGTIICTSIHYVLFPSIGGAFSFGDLVICINDLLEYPLRSGEEREQTLRYISGSMLIQLKFLITE